MSAHITADQIDQRDPIVAYWLYECGLTRRPVDIRLQGDSQHDVTVQADRLKRAFGDLLTIESPHLSRKSSHWVAFGKLGEDSRPTLGALAGAGESTPESPATEE